MTSPDALDVLDAFGSAGFGHLVDGGWGVDALVGEQTRRHEDLDLVVARSDLPRADPALRPLGFAHAAGEEPGLPARLVLRAPGGRQVDLHPVVFDEEGNGRQDLGDGTSGVYPPPVSPGVGGSRDTAVPCLPRSSSCGSISATSPAPATGTTSPCSG